MKKYSPIRTLTTLGAGMLFAASVAAAPVTDFETSLENSSVSVTSSSGVSLGSINATLSESLSGNRFSLAENESYTFDFFNISLPVVGAGRAQFDATLGFLEPITASASAAASGRWGSVLLGSAGRLTWDQQPGIFETDDGASFEVSFSDLKGVQLGRDTTVTATVTKLASGLRPDDPASVPEPGTLALFALGLLGLGMSRSRRASAAS